MKKLLLSLGAVAAVVAPVASVIACGSSDDKKVSALDQTKALDVKTINASSMSAADKTSAIAKINDAKDVASLTKVMQDLASKLGATGTQAPTTTNADDTYAAPEAKYADAFDTLANEIAEVAGDVDDTKKVEVKGDLVRVTLTTPVTPADEADVEPENNQPKPVATRITLNRKTVKVVSMEQKLAGGEFTLGQVPSDDDHFVASFEESLKDLNFVIKSIDASEGTTIAGRTATAAKADAKTKATALLATIHYTMADTDLNSLVDYLVTTAGPEAVLNLEGINQGIKTGDAKHGEDDYMILIKGDKTRTLSGDKFSTDEYNSHVALKMTSDDGSVTANIGNELDPEDKTLEGRWGETTAEAAQSRFVIYFQTDGQQKTTCQVSEVVKFGNKYFKLDTAKRVAGSPELFVNDFALHEFTAKEIPAV